PMMTIPPTPTPIATSRQGRAEDFCAGAAGAAEETRPGAAMPPAGASKRALQNRQSTASVWIVSPHWGQGRVSSAMGFEGNYRERPEGIKRKLPNPAKTIPPRGRA